MLVRQKEALGENQEGHPNSSHRRKWGGSCWLTVKHKSVSLSGTDKSAGSMRLFPLSDRRPAGAWLSARDVDVTGALMAQARNPRLPGSP